MKPENVGNKLKYYRRIYELSISKMADKLKINPGILTKIEDGKLDISLGLFVRICECINVSPNELLAYSLPMKDKYMWTDYLVDADILAVCEVPNKTLADKIIESSKFLSDELTFGSVRILVYPPCEAPSLDVVRRRENKKNSLRRIKR